MIRAFRYRIYPTEQQKQQIHQHFDAARLIYNLSLETKIAAYKSNGTHLSYIDITYQLKELKQDHNWLYSVYHHTLCAAIKSMDFSFKQFFTGNNGFPKFKSKKEPNKSYVIPDHVKVDFSSGRINLPKIDTPIKATIHREFNGLIKSTTVSLTNTGKYFVSVSVDDKLPDPIPAPVDESTAIGIDLGIHSLITTSKGEKINNPLFLKRSLNKLKFFQRKLSIKKKGSASYRKLKIKIAKQHEKVANQRNDYLHKVTTKLIRDNQTICMETLSVKNMTKLRSLSQKIADSALGTIPLMLEYKAKWQGKNLLKLGRFEPSSKVGNICNHINNDLSLKDRVWTCHCGITYDRDENAAIVIKQKVLKNYLGKAKPEKLMELPALAGAKKLEVKQPKHSPKKKGSVLND